MPINMELHYDGHKRLLGMVEPTYKRVRAVFNGETIADTPNAFMLYDSLYAPRYLFPKADVRMEVLTAQAETGHNRMYQTITYHDVTLGEQTAEKAAITYQDPRGDQTDISEFVAFEWNAMDAWYVEDEEEIGHARHPYLRIDLRDSSRRVQVSVGGKIIADSTRATVLFETGLLPRYYIPVDDIDADVLQPVTTHTVCPYKGEASYYDVVVDGKRVADAAWYYPTPDRMLASIMGKLAFYNEHEDITITVADQ